MIIWLMLYFTGAAVHVGNYPDMNSCVNAANSSTTITIPNARSFSATFICVPANTGKKGDPGPPH